MLLTLVKFAPLVAAWHCLLQVAPACIAAAAAAAVSEL